MTVLNFHSEQHRETPIDLFVEEPFSFDDEYRQALRVHLDQGATLPILRLDALLQMKIEPGRPQDLADVAELRLLHKERRRMTKSDGWEAATWDGNRLRQHQEFLALPFQEKLRRIEQLADAADAVRAAMARSPDVADVSS